jgi:hypothetical protein
MPLFGWVGRQFCTGREVGYEVGRGYVVILYALKEHRHKAKMRKNII